MVWAAFVAGEIGGPSMTEQPEILEEAIELAMLLQEAPDDPELIAAVRDFRQRGAAHEAAWTRVSGTAGAATRVMDEQERAAATTAHDLSRRNFVIGGLVALGGGTIAAAGLPGLFSRAGADHVTARGELREIRLDDGSLAVLGPDSAVAVDFAENRRAVRLLAGLGYFQVAAGRGAFELQAGDLRLTTADAAFDVATEPGRIEVAVQRGELEARAAADRLTLAADDWARYRGADGWVRGSRPFAETVSWRDRHLMAEDEMLSALVERIGRWLPQPVVVLDPVAAGTHVSGIFDLSDPARALEAAVRPTGAKLRRIGELMTVVSPI